MTKDALNLSMALCFEELRSVAASEFNKAYDGRMDKDQFYAAMRWLKQMCDTRIDRIEAIEVTDPTNVPR